MSKFWSVAKDVVTHLAMEFGYWTRHRWRQAGVRGRTIAVAALGLLVLTVAFWDYRDVPGHWWDYQRGNRPLMAANSWHYNLDKIDVDRLAQTTEDVLVIDFARGSNGSIALTPDEVARLKKRPDGRPRTVLAYMSIGEADTFRWYWRSDWKGDDAPGWDVMENCAWPNAHLVRFWHDGWKDIIYRGQRSYLQRIIAAGFDGVYLDRVDVYTQLLAERPTARDDMIDFVIEIAEAARAEKPNFLIVPQNGEDLLSERDYRDAIDGLGKEDLLYGDTGTGVRNKAAAITTSKSLLQLLIGDFKPVLAVEYLTTKDAIATTEKEMRSLGLVPTFAHRSLDGLDPTLPRGDDTKQWGTPEWIAANCKDKPHW